jgi:hypothetical protein
VADTLLAIEQLLTRLVGSLPEGGSTARNPKA